MRRLIARLRGARRGAAEVRGGVRSSRVGGVRLVAARLEVAPGRWGDVVRAVAAVAAEACAAAHTLGQVTLVAGEEPILLAVRARPDLVAGRVQGALQAGAAHRRPTLWLAMRQGIFVGSLVDSGRPFEPTGTAIAAIVAAGHCTHALLTEVGAGAAGVALRLDLYAAPPLLRAAVSSARRHFAVLSARPH